METVIGLGAAGCRIADAFAIYPQYTTYKIDVGLKGENCFSLQPKHSPEDYERSVPDMSAFFEKIEGDILFVVGGGGKISGATLQILKQAKVDNINILYIKPYSKALTKTGLLQDRATFHILQEYARSGLFANIYLVDNLLLDNIVGEVPILEYNKKLNELIVSAFHYINVFKNSEKSFTFSGEATFSLTTLKDLTSSARMSLIKTASIKPVLVAASIIIAFF